LALSWRDVGIVSAVSLISFLIVGGFPHLLKAFPLDDSWIHQVVARNLAHYGKLGFIPGVWSSGSSSLLWTLVLAVNWKFLPGVNPVAYSDVLNLVFLIAIGLAMLAMARRDGLARPWCWMWALGPVLSGNFVWLGLLGMEHILFVALSVVGIYLWFEPGLRSAVLCACCLGALSMTRPEGLVLAGLAAIAFRLARRSWREVGIVMAVVAICVAAFLWANFLTSHSWLPMTYEGRKWLYFGSVHVPWKARFTFLLSLGLTISRPWSAKAPTVLFLQMSVLALIAIGVFRVFRERRLRMGFLCVWSFALIGAYFVMLPAMSHGGRYQPLFLALNLPLMFLGIESLVGVILPKFKSPRREMAARSAVLITICVLTGLASLAVWRQIARDSTATIESTHETMGRYIVAHVPAEAKVAAFDIGRIGYIYGGKLIDLGGLTNSKFLPYMQQHRMMDYLEARHVEYFVWPSDRDGASMIPDELTITPEIRERLVTVKSFCAPVVVWKINLEAIGNATPCQVLYRVKAAGASPAVPAHN